MTDKQPEALQLARLLEIYDKPINMTAAAELRRLHEVNAELVEACQLVIRAYNKLQPASSNQGKEPLEIFAIRAALAKATRREQCQQIKS